VNLDERNITSETFSAIRKETPAVAAHRAALELGVAADV
jgi:hypothetical protein